MHILVTMSNAPQIAEVAALVGGEEDDMQTSQNGKLAFTVTWRARDGEADACANIIARFLSEARKERA